MSTAEVQVPEQPEQTPADDTTTVPVPEQPEQGDADAADDGEHKLGSHAEKRMARNERRNSERAELRKEAEARAKEASELRAEISRMREEQAEMRGRFAQQAQQQQPQQDPLIALYAQADKALQDVADNKADMRRYHEIQAAIARTVAAQQLQEFAQSQAHQPQIDATRALLESEFGWLSSNAKARRWADGAYDQLVAEGRPDGIATMREALAKTAAALNLGTPPGRVNDSTRGKYVGVSTKDTGASRGGSIDAVRMDDATRSLAEAYWPDVKPREAYARMAALLSSSNKGDE